MKTELRLLSWLQAGNGQTTQEANVKAGRALSKMSNSKSKCTKTLYQIVLVVKYSASCHVLSIAKGPGKKRFMVFENGNESKG
jgi:hypothetical protein